MKPHELRAMPETELSQRMLEMLNELTAIRLKARQGAVEQPHRIRQMRREIAQMLTVLAERKKAVAKSQQEPG